MAIPNAVAHAQNDSTVAASAARSLPAEIWALEARIGQRNGVMRFAGELRRRFDSFYSVDAAFLLNPIGVQVGFSVYPWPMLFAQATVGVAAISEIGIKAPDFKSEFIFGLRGGLKTEALSRSYAYSLSIGSLWAVDTDYCHNCGGVNPDFIAEYRFEVRAYLLIEAGLSFYF